MPVGKIMIKSVYSPKFIAAFRLQGIGKTIGYLFFMALLLWLPAFAAVLLFLGTGSTSAEQAMYRLAPFTETVSGGTLLFVSLAFYYVTLSFSLFLKVVLFAAGGIMAARVMHKRAEYRHLFRMAAFAVTLPTLLTVLLQTTGVSLPGDYAALWGVHAVLLYLAIQKLPAAPK